MSEMLSQKTLARRVFSRLGAGRILYHAWHQPVAWIARSRLEGGPLEQWITRQHRLAMVAAARDLEPLPVVPADALEVCYLTGRRFWYQTAFCAWTLAKHAGRPLRFVFVDDGSFDHAIQREALRLFPGCVVMSASELESQLDRLLPTDRFPMLRSQRRTYLHLRKLTDMHAGHCGWRLVLDSDMLFFRYPRQLMSWLGFPSEPIHMQDVKDSYGYPAEDMTRIVGRSLPSLLNVGVLGLRSDAIDWELLEYWCRKLLESHGTSYYLEQGLVAMLLAGKHCLRLSQSEYRLMPNEEETTRPSAVLHHYVAESKRIYFRMAWRASLEAARQQAAPSCI